MQEMCTAVALLVKRKIKLKNKCDAWISKLQVNIVINIQKTNLTITAVDYF